MIGIKKILLTIILSILIMMLFIYIKNDKISGSNKYVFQSDSKNLSQINVFNSNDICCKYILELIINEYKSNKRKYLFDTSKRSIIKQTELIYSNPHTILNLRKRLNINDIKYISTIEFNEDYKNNHWYKSVLSDCVNMAVIIQPESFEGNIVTESDIINDIIPFKNIHFNYSETYFKTLNSPNKLNEFLNLKINIKIYDLSNNFIRVNLRELKHKLNEKTLLSIFEDIYNEINLYNWYMFEFSNKITLSIYKIQTINDYEEYIKFSLACHLIESGYFNFNKSIFNNYVETLLKLQTKSNYLLKFFNISSLTTDNFQITLKNEEITCPNPDCFMIEYN